jgi:hypothetical protein
MSVINANGRGRCVMSHAAISTTVMLKTALMEGCVGLSLTLETNCHLIGAGLGARVTHRIGVFGPPGVTGGVIIGADVRYGRDHIPPG